MSYEDDLAAHDGEWEGIKPRQPKGMLPLGTYQVEVIEARVERAGGDYDDLQLVLVFEVITGDLEGSQHRKWSSLDTEIGREIAKQDCFNLGLEVPLCSDLPKMTAMLIGRRAEIKLVQGKAKRDGGYWTNTYINKLLDPQDSSNYIDPPPIEDMDHDKPF